MSKGQLVFALAIGHALLGAGAARANTVQDQLGQGARAKAMGGAGTASASDSSATYYNPARLSECAGNQVDLELGHLHYGLGVESEDSRAEDADLSGRTALGMGVCLQLPYGLHLGLVFDTGLQQGQRLSQRSLDSRPEFALYGPPLEQVSLMLGLGKRVGERLSLGLGAALMINSALALSVQVPVIAGEQELAGDLQWELEPTAAFYAGAQYELSDELLVAATLRTPMYHKLEAEALTTVNLAGVLLDVDLLLESVAWYSPLQASLGASYQLGATVLTADLSWYHWSAYAGPYMHISPLDPNDPVAAGLNYPPEEDLGLQDTFAPRIGVETRLNKALALRAGLSYRSSATALPRPEARANLLDGALSSLSLGAAYHWSRAASEKGGSAARNSLGLFARLQHMADQDVRKEIEDEEDLDYRFGGVLIDFGLSLTMGW